MGRRALRRIEAELDLSQHLKKFDDLPRPWNAAALLGRDAPLEIEVGTGKGLFLSAAAAAQGETNFFGVEIIAKYARFAAARLAKQQLSNAVILHGDAMRLFGELLPNDALAAVHVYFPDPWWKARHKKRRVMRPAFVKDVERTLQVGGSLHFWTDVQEYFDTTLELLAAETTLCGPLTVGEKPATHDLDYRTHFERRVRMDGQPIYRAEFRKIGAVRNA